jgi:hypothetical protein
MFIEDGRNVPAIERRQGKLLQLRYWLVGNLGHALPQFLMEVVVVVWGVLSRSNGGQDSDASSMVDKA